VSSHYVRRVDRIGTRVYFADIRHECRHVDQTGYLGVDARLADDNSTPRMTDKDDRAILKGLSKP